MRLIIAALTSITLLSACASEGINRGAMEQLVEVTYAKVIHTKPVVFESKAGEAALIGALDGVVESAHYGSFEEVAAGAIVGAILSTVVVTIEEGPRDGLLVKLRSSDNTHYNVVTKHTDIQIGECLELIQSDQVSVLPVDSSLCHGSPVGLSGTDSEDSIRTVTAQ